jgi:hypothetical protein
MKDKPIDSESKDHSKTEFLQQSSKDQQSDSSEANPPESIRLPEPDLENITVLTHSLPNTPILPWNRYDSPWDEAESEQSPDSTSESETKSKADGEDTENLDKVKEQESESESEE